MEVGQIWRDTVLKYTDELSGRLVTRLTDYYGHSNNLYFTDNFWLDNGQKFIFMSDREGCSNLFLYDLSNNIITQLTAFDDRALAISGQYVEANASYYFWHCDKLYELNINTLKTRLLYEGNNEFIPGVSISVSANGRYAYFCILKREDLVFRSSIDYPHSLHLYTFYKKMPPLSRIVKLDIHTLKTDVIYEERYFLQHINANPTKDYLLTFCHEGLWAKVDQRIWCMNTDTGEVWKIRVQDGDAAIGHEYWFKDGERIGYHGRRLPDEKMHFWGSIKWDNTEQIEYDFPFHCSHFSGNDINLAIGDGRPRNVQPWFQSDTKPYIMLIKKEEDKFIGPKVLAFHGSTFNDQKSHPHASLTPDGKHVIYTSDLTGYANIYIVEIGDFYSLPDV